MNAMPLLSGYELRKWNWVVRLAGSGLPPEQILRRTGIARSTYFDRMAKLRAEQARKSELSRKLYDL